MAAGRWGTYREKCPAGRIQPGGVRVGRIGGRSGSGKPFLAGSAESGEGILYRLRMNLLSWWRRSAKLGAKTIGILETLTI